MAPVVVEFFGIPRQRAGKADLTLQAATVAELLTALEAHCPGLRGLRRPDGSLTPHYLLSIDGRRFVGRGDEAVPEGAHVLLLSADAGG